MDPKIARRDTIAARRIYTERGEMLAPLAMEIFGDRYERFRWPWCAEVLGIDCDGRWIIDWIEPAHDWQESNSVGTRGVQRRYLLRHGGIYLVRRQLSWRRSEMFFVVSNNGALTKLSEDEVRGCLESED